MKDQTDPLLIEEIRKMRNDGNLQKKLKNDFGRRLEDLMKANKITKERLSEIFEVSLPTVYNWINGKYEPHFVDIIALAKLFGVNVGVLYGSEDCVNVKNEK